MQIDVYSNYCKVQGTKDELQEVRTAFTVDVPGAKYSSMYRRGRWDGKKRFFNIVSRALPVGFLGLFCKTFPTASVTDYREFPKINDKPPVLNEITLRDYQNEAFVSCLKAQNCLIHAATNAGKTAMFSGIIQKMYPHNTMVVVHRDELLRQCIKMVEKYTGLEVGFITSKDTYIQPITVGMITTLINRIGADEEITEFYENLQCIIVDETHHAASASYTTLLSNCRAPFRFGFSGTIDPEDTHKGMLIRSYLGSVEFRITNQELIDLGVSAKPKIFLYELDVTSRLTGVYQDAKDILIEEAGGKAENVTARKVVQKVYQLCMDRGIVQNNERNAKVLEIVRNNPDVSILAVVDRLEHGQLIKEILTNNGVKAQFISGESFNRRSALDAFSKGELKVLVSTNIIDEGVDIERIGVLILLAGKKSERQVLQRVGRSLRKKHGVNTVKIYDFIDFNNKYLERHSKQRLKIYRNEGFEIEFCT